MSGAERLNLDADGCMKRVWVLSVLSDDEALDDPRDLPRGLSFHLSRCGSCRALADRLLGVTESLGGLGALDASDELVESANRRARTALQAGGKPTGRVSLADSIDLTAPDEEARGGGWLSVMRYAVAAAVVLAAATFGLSAFRGASGPYHPLRRSIVERAPILRNVPVHRPSLAPDPADAQLASSLGDAEDAGLATAAPSEFGLFDPTATVADGFDVLPAEAAGTFSTLVQRRPQEAPTPPPTNRYRRHHSHIDAALCDDPHCIPTAMVLPGGARRMMQSRPGPFDNRPAEGFTSP